MFINVEILTHFILQELPKGNWFCCTDCNRIHSALEKLVARGEERLPDSCLNVIKKKSEENILENGNSIDVRWRLLNGKIDPFGDTEALLSEALAIFHVRDCFSVLRTFSFMRK